MSEVLLYRSKKGEVQRTLLLAILYLLISLTFLLAHPSNYLYISSSALFLVMSVMLETKTMADTKNGICRRIWSRYRDFPYPPLNEWAESLEERDAFEVEDALEDSL